MNALICAATACCIAAGSHPPLAAWDPALAAYIAAAACIAANGLYPDMPPADIAANMEA